MDDSSCIFVKHVPPPHVCPAIIQCWMSGNQSGVVQSWADCRPAQYTSSVCWVSMFSGTKSELTCKIAMFHPTTRIFQKFKVLMSTTSLKIAEQFNGLVCIIYNYIDIYLYIFFYSYKYMGPGTLKKVSFFFSKQAKNILWWKNKIKWQTI